MGEQEEREQVDEDEEEGGGRGVDDEDDEDEEEGIFVAIRPGLVPALGVPFTFSIDDFLKFL